MKAWYSKVRDTELIDGSVRADYVVTFETDNFELKRKVEKYLQGIMDEAEQTENCSENPNNCTDCECTDDCTECKEAEHGCKDEPQRDMAEDIVRSYGFKAESYQQAKAKDEPQTDGYISGEDFMKIFDEPQTDRSMAVGKRSDATADKYNLYGKTTTDEPQTDCAWKKGE